MMSATSLQTIPLAELAKTIGSNAWRWNAIDFADALGLHRMSPLAYVGRPEAADMGTLRKWEAFKGLSRSMQDVVAWLKHFTPVEIAAMFSTPTEQQIAENQ